MCLTVGMLEVMGLCELSEEAKAFCGPQRARSIPCPALQEHSNLNEDFVFNAGFLAFYYHEGLIFHASFRQR